MRSTAITTATIMLLAFGAACLAEQRPIVGAIRWDAWTGGEITKQVERTLGPKKYHHRLPWFAQVIDDQTVKIDGGRQEVMDREIDYAADAGLDYWAFLIYPADNSMSKALGQYLKSPRRKRIGLCMILANTLRSSESHWPAERDRAIALLREPGYLKVLDDRPLVYTFVNDELAINRFGEFLAEARKQGLNPYSVYMGWHPSRDYQKVADRGFDAVSAYASGGDQATFAELVQWTQTRYWADAARAKVPYIPMVSTGWDKNPRKDHPVSWELDHPYHTQTVFPSRAEPGQIAAHLAEAIKFVDQHPQSCPARAVILYAWNENDEGGWLSPTRSPAGTPDTSRLDAIKRVLTPAATAPRAD